MICGMYLDRNKAKNSTQDSAQKLKEKVVILNHQLEEAHSKIEESQKIIEQKDLELKSKDETITSLYEKLKLSLQRQFGKKSEKSENLDGIVSGDEGSKEELEPIAFDDPKVTNKSEIETADEEITVASHTRKKRGRKPLPANLPREEVIHDLKDEEKVCSCCGGALTCFGEDRSEQLQYVPAKMIVRVNIRRKYACRGCEGTVKSAELPKQLIQKSVATAGLLAHITVSKYTHHLPLYRQEVIFRQLGVDLPRNTMCLWMMKVAEACKPIYEIMGDAIRNGNYANADESPLRVLKEKGLSKKTKSYMFVYLGGDREKPSIVFKCHPTRHGANAEEFFKGFKGYLQTDAFSGYESAFKDNPAVIQMGCFAHARRKFSEIVKITNNPGLAHEAIEQIKELYKIEKYARENNSSNAERKKLREKEAKPI